MDGHNPITHPTVYANETSFEAEFIRQNANQVAAEFSLRAQNLEKAKKRNRILAIIIAGSLIIGLAAQAHFLISRRKTAGQPENQSIETVAIDNLETCVVGVDTFMIKSLESKLYRIVSYQDDLLGKAAQDYYSGEVRMNSCDVKRKSYTTNLYTGAVGTQYYHLANFVVDLSGEQYSFSVEFVYLTEDDTVVDETLDLGGIMIYCVDGVPDFRCADNPFVSKP